MDLILIRKHHLSTGIFGELTLGDGVLVAVTLEHPYPNGKGGYSAKVASGGYVAKRGVHKLKNLIPFETFEVTGVKDHWGILFHTGNYADDSSGCILLGKYRVDNMIAKSKKAFDAFMAIQNGCNEFWLKVI